MILLDELQALALHLFKLLDDTIFSIQKDFVKYLLLTLVGWLFNEFRSAGKPVPVRKWQPNPNLQEWQEQRLHELAEERRARARHRAAGAAVAVTLCALVVGALARPPPPAPPPPPPPLLMQLVRTTGSRSLQAVRYCRTHWVEVVVVASSLLLADYLNVLVTLDRMDPIVRLAQKVLRQAGGAARALSTVLSHQRARAAAQAVEASVTGQARARTLGRALSSVR